MYPPINPNGKILSIEICLTEYQMIVGFYENLNKKLYKKVYT